MMKLSEDHRMAVTMFDIQGIPHAEIAKILRVSEGTVRSRLFTPTGSCKTPFRSLRRTRNRRFPLSHEPMHRIIRLKRYEQPPEGYFEDFLRDFHRRQRAELLRPSIGELLLDRINSLLAEIRVPAMADAGAAAVAVVASVVILRQPGAADATPRLRRGLQPAPGDRSFHATGLAPRRAADGRSV